MRFPILIAILLTLSACSKPAPEAAPQASKDETLKTYALHGEVLRLDPQGKIAAIKHQAIGDWMPPMTMEFPVKDQKDFDALHAGEKINATVYVKSAVRDGAPVTTEFWVGNVHEDTAAPPQQH